MQTEKYQKIVARAENIMKNSPDPIHDRRHVLRVIENIEQICEANQIVGAQKEALILSAWWHDVSRTITKFPSFIWMLFLDDLISAFLLFKFCLRNWLFGYEANTAIKIVFCKSVGAGRLLTRILLRKKDWILLDILKDADMLDVMHVERIRSIMPLSELSKIYLFNYKRLVNYSLKLKNAKFKTQSALKQFEQIIQQLIIFLSQPEILAWHIEQFGKKWCGEVEKKLNELLNYIKILNLQTI